MRLIDADALKEIIENSYEVTWDHDYNGGFKDACVLILDEIDSAPTIEPERKKGKWVDLKCDQCGQVDMSKPNYCPNCGVDMRGEDNG